MKTETSKSKNKMNKILITGGTGQFGRAAIEFLLKKGILCSQISALVKDGNKALDLKEKGVSIIEGNYNDYSSLLNAFNGIDKLLFVSSSDMVNRMFQHENVVKAAKEAGVKHIIYTSSERKSESEESPLSFVSGSHIATENAIKKSGITYTIMRNNLYMDMLPWFLGENILETGIFFPAGDGKVRFILRSEMAEVAANILITNNHENKEYYISGSTPVSFEQIAGILSEITSKAINYNSTDYQDYVETIVGTGIPKEYAKMFGGFAEAIRQGELNPDNSDIVRLLGREPVPVKDYLSNVYSRQL